MKFLAIILILVLSAPPVQAEACDMGAGQSQESGHSMAHSGADDHACCDPEPADEPQGCEGGMDCCPCYVNASVLPTLPRLAAGPPNSLVVNRLTGVLLPSHGSPPYRPPIS